MGISWEYHGNIMGISWEYHRNIHCLVVEPYPSEKWWSEFVNGLGMTSHIWHGKSSKCLKPPTSLWWFIQISPTWGYSNESTWDWVSSAVEVPWILLDEHPQIPAVWFSFLESSLLRVNWPIAVSSHHAKRWNGLKYKRNAVAKKNTPYCG